MGSVVVAMYGGYNQIGRTGLLAIPASVNQALTAIRPNSKTLNSHYLLSVLNFRVEYWKSIASSSRKDPNITGRDVAAFPIALPPVLEQAYVAEALSDADALIESLEQLLAKKRQIKQGAMQQLLTGKKRLPGFSGEWVKERFGEIAFARAGRIDPHKIESHEFCIELEHIEPRSGTLVGHSSTNTQSSLKSIFQPGDVLFGKLRAYLRKYWLADRAGVCSTEIWCLVPKGLLKSNELLFQLVQTDAFIDSASMSYGTHMPRSDWSSVKGSLMDIPCDETEQTGIAALLSDMDSEIAALDARLAKARQLKQGMMQVLLTGAIRLPLATA